MKYYGDEMFLVLCYGYFFFCGFYVLWVKLKLFVFKFFFWGWGCNEEVVVIVDYKLNMI